MDTRSRPLRLVALGDSYTIGTGVKADERWPNQLVRRLRGQGVPLELVANLGVNGYASADLIRHELPLVARLDADLVTLLIGVNDVVQGVSADHYLANLRAILATLLGRFAPSRIVTISTPDYTVTPAGRDYGDPAARAAAIRELNRLLRAASHARGIAHVDIHDLSLRAAADPSLVAADGLHPSGAQYALWVERIVPVVVGLLARDGPRPDLRANPSERT